MGNDSKTVHFTINGRPVEASAGTSVAAAMMNEGVVPFRRSVTGEGRGPLCGMGICFECRVTIDGQSHQKSCQIVARAGMDVVSDA
jgi:sarcosine oxidase subunit alpha